MYSDIYENILDKKHSNGQLVSLPLSNNDNSELIQLNNTRF